MKLHSRTCCRMPETLPHTYCPLSVLLGEVSAPFLIAVFGWSYWFLLSSVASASWILDRSPFSDVWVFALLQQGVIFFLARVYFAFLVGCLFLS